MRKDKPYIICHMIVSLNGKATGNFLLDDKNSHSFDEYYRIHRETRGDGFICGRKTMESSFTHNFYPDLLKFKGEKIAKTDFILPNDGYYYAICFDRQGRLGWKDNVIHDEDPGYDNAHIIEVVTEQAKSEYLLYLRSMNIPYIFAGKTDIDINLALHKLKTKFNITNLLLEGGPTLNGAFLKANVIDEVSLIEVPVEEEFFEKNLFEPGNLNGFTKTGDVILDYKVIYKRYKKI